MKVLNTKCVKGKKPWAIITKYLILGMDIIDEKLTSGSI